MAAHGLGPHPALDQRRQQADRAEIQQHPAEMPTDISGDKPPPRLLVGQEMPQVQYSRRGDSRLAQQGHQQDESGEERTLIQGETGRFPPLVPTGEARRQGDGQCQQRPFPEPKTRRQNHDNQQCGATPQQSGEFHMPDQIGQLQHRQGDHSQPDHSRAGQT
jgi:hypothetical protein